MPQIVVAQNFREFGDASAHACVIIHKVNYCFLLGLCAVPNGLYAHEAREFEFFLPKSDAIGLEWS